jgi:hypothetical protein
MTETLTIEEINQRYPDEWVLIGEPETDETLEVLRGKVLYHGKDRDEMYQAAKDLPSPKYFATHFTGEFPADMVIIL